MKPDELWDLTFKEFSHIIKYKENEVEREWDIARTMGMWTISPHSKKKVKPKDLLKLPSDKVPQNPSSEEMARIINDWNKR